MTDQQTPRSAWMKWAGFVCGGLGILILGLALLQSFTSVALLEDPTTGGMIFLFLGFSLLMLDRARAAKANQEDTA